MIHIGQNDHGLGIMKMNVHTLKTLEHLRKTDSGGGNVSACAAHTFCELNQVAKSERKIQSILISLVRYLYIYLYIGSNNYSYMSLSNMDELL